MRGGEGGEGVGEEGGGVSLVLHSQPLPGGEWRPRLRLSQEGVDGEEAEGSGWEEREWRGEEGEEGRRWEGLVRGEEEATSERVVVVRQGSLDAEQCEAIGPGLKRAFLGRPANFVIRPRDCHGHARRMARGSPFRLWLLNSPGTIDSRVEPQPDGCAPSLSPSPPLHPALSHLPFPLLPLRSPQPHPLILLRLLNHLPPPPLPLPHHPPIPTSPYSLCALSLQPSSSPTCPSALLACTCWPSPLQAGQSRAPPFGWRWASGPSPPVSSPDPPPHLRG